MNKHKKLITTALAAGAIALVGAGWVAPAAFAASETPTASASPSAAVDYEQPTVPSAESLAAAGLVVKGLTITPGTDSYTVSADSVTLANGSTDAVLSIGDNRAHNGGVNYVNWLEITSANDGQSYTAVIPATNGDYTVTVSAGFTGTDGNPLLTNLAETAVTVAGE